MRELFTVRFWAAIVGLVVLAVVAVLVSSRSDPAQPLSSPAETVRRIDTGGVIVSFRPEVDWALRDGVTDGSVDLVLGDGRVFLLGDRTPGVIDCDGPERYGSCTLLADLLGDAVVWFAIVPAERGGQVTLPGVVAVLDQGREARLSNGWVVPLVDVVRRECPSVETTSFRDFVARVGGESVAIYDLSIDEVTTVACLPPAPATDTD
jgi:hypothetical protein